MPGTSRTFREHGPVGTGGLLGEIKEEPAAHAAAGGHSREEATGFEGAHQVATMQGDAARPARECVLLPTTTGLDSRPDRDGDEAGRGARCAGVSARKRMLSSKAQAAGDAGLLPEA